MSVIIELRPEIEAKLTAQAAEQGVSLAQYARRLVEEQIAGGTTLSTSERVAFWRESVKDLPRTPPCRIRQSVARASMTREDERPR